MQVYKKYTLTLSMFLLMTASIFLPPIKLKSEKRLEVKAKQKVYEHL